MIMLKADGWYRLRGRGFVANIKAGQLPDDIYDPAQLVGHYVNIDREIFFIKNVETRAIARSESNPYRGPFGALVAEVDE